MIQKLRAHPDDPHPHKSLHKECPDCRGSGCNDFYLMTFEDLQKIWVAARQGMRMGDSTEAYKGFDRWFKEQIQ